MTRRSATIVAVAILLILTGATVVVHRWMTAPVAALSAPGWRCTGTITGRDTYGTLEVPAGRTCRLDDVHQTGRVQVSPGGVLILRGTTVLGDLFVADSPRFEVSRSTITGMAVLDGPGKVEVHDNYLADLRVGPQAGALDITGNVVLGNLVVEGQHTVDHCHTNVVVLDREGVCHS